MRHENDRARLLIEDRFERGNSSTNAGVVGDFAVLDRDVEIDADEDPLTVQVEIANGHFVHHLPLMRKKRRGR